jgi:hypothetical protein
MGVVHWVEMSIGRDEECEVLSLSLVVWNAVRKRKKNAITC